MQREIQEQEVAKASLLQQFDEREEETKRRWNITIQSTKKISDEYIQKLTSDAQQMYDSNRSHETARPEAKASHEAAKQEADAVHERDKEAHKAIQS